jgi:hypothetical protein
MMKERIVLTTLLSSSILLSASCSTTVVSPDAEATAVYRMGKLSSTISADINTTYTAAEAAMQELGLSIVQRSKDQLEARVVARDSQDSRIVVQMLALTDGLTRLSIDASPLAKARRTYQAVLDNLPKSPAASSLSRARNSIVGPGR